jgi:predicted peptidase
VFLDEGVYVGYRYFDTFGKEDRVAYPFGHGLSYTTFSYTDLALSKSHFSATDESDAIGVSVKVTNTGKVAGRAVAELYLGASTYAEEGRPAKELKRYAKTGLLAPGASETATFTIAKRDLQYFDDGAADPLAVVGAAPNAVSNVTYDGPGWTVAPGTRFTVTVGGTSDGAVLEAQGAKAAFDYGQVDSRGFELIAQVEEYGAVVSAAVIELGAGASASAADVGAAKFEVKTRGLNSAGQPNARLTERNIARAYPSAAPAIDPAHRGAASGRYIVLELEYGYGNANESSLIQYVTETDSSSGRPIGRNVQKPVASDYAIRQTAAVGGIPASTQYACSGVRTLVADDFARLATAADGLAYRLFSPQRQAGAKYPLVVWLHGAGEGGTDNAAQILANKGGTAFANPAAQARHPAFVAAPQCANAFSWELGDSKKVHSMIREIVAANPAIDADRIYALGCSMGGFMTWSAILGDPSVFAAAAPICAATSFFSPALSATDYAKARDLPMWLFQGGLDPTVDPAATRAAYEGLAAAGKVPGGAFKYTVFPTVAYNEHWSWVPVLNDCYDGATLGFMDWLFAQSRAGAGSAGREIAVAPGTGGAASNIAPAAPAAAAGGSAAGGKGGKGGESGESGEYGKGGKGGGSGAGGEPSKAPGRPGGAVGAGGSAASGSVSGSEIAGASHGYKIDVAGAAPQVGGDGTVTIPQGASADIAIGDGVVVRAPGGTAVSPEGRIRIPVGSGGATASLPDGSSVRIPQGYAVFEDAGAPLGFAYEYENPFIDVGAGDWFHGAVQRTVENGLFNGTSQNTFSPNGTMTRAMIVTVLHRMEGQPRGAGASGFADVPAGQWHSEAVAWGEANGIVLGFTETRFGGDEPVAREQIAAILYRYAAYKGRDVSGGADIGGFADAALVSGYALEAVRWAVGEGLIQGRGANDIAPQGNATRAEVAAIIQRYMER